MTSQSISDKMNRCFQLGLLNLASGLLVLCVVARADSSVDQHTQRQEAATTPATSSLHVPNLNQIKLFSDSQLPRSQVTGEYVQHLGRVMLLDTFLPPKSAADLPTKFSLHNNFVSLVNETYKIVDQTKGQLFEFDLDQLRRIQFKPYTRTVIMIAGYRSKEHVRWISRARELLLSLDPTADVIEVYWTSSNQGLYPQAVAHTPLVARQITILLHYLAQLSGTSLEDQRFLDNIHLIGHSLGAHIAGFVGQDLSGRAGRVTGLDPAGPSFDRMPAAKRLDQSDAQLVDVLHTNAGKMKYLKAIPSILAHQAVKSMPNSFRDSLRASSTSWLGIDVNVGHLDFYANDGRVQPGCWDPAHICDHGRASQIYVELLEHERRVMEHVARGDPNLFLKWRKQFRQLAFSADSYAEFISGSQLTLEAAAPVDLLTPTSELVEELETNHGIKLATNQSNISKHYFKTLASDHLIGQHFLLQLLIRHKSDFSGCSLKAAVRFHGGTQISELMVTDENFETDGNTSFIRQTLRLPFVSPNDPIEHIRDLAGHQFKQEQGDNTRELLEKFYPNRISLAVTKKHEDESKSSSLFGSIMSKIVGGEKSCPAVEILAVQVTPVQATDRIRLEPLTKQVANLRLFYEGHRDSRDSVKVTQEYDFNQMKAILDPDDKSPEQMFFMSSVIVS